MLIDLSKGELDTVCSCIALAISYCEDTAEKAKINNCTGFYQNMQKVLNNYETLSIKIKEYFNNYEE